MLALHPHRDTAFLFPSSPDLVAPPFLPPVVVGTGAGAIVGTMMFPEIGTLFGAVLGGLLCASVGAPAVA